MAVDTERTCMMRLVEESRLDVVNGEGAGVVCCRQPIMTSETESITCFYELANHKNVCPYISGDGLDQACQYLGTVVRIQRYRVFFRGSILLQLST
jgi:hypothetical protein